MRLSEQSIADIVSAVRSVVEPAAIILFGSRARGTAHEQSDIDLLVIRNEPFQPGDSRRRELGRIYRAVTAASPLPKDILLYTSAEYRDWRETINHPLAEAAREGRVLYGQV